MIGIRVVRYLWASPWTVVGAVMAAPVALSRGRVAVHTGVLEIHGGLLGKLLPRLGPGIEAITIGHCVWAATERGLHQTRSHERVHVAQFERWGPLFPALYGAASVLAWWRGRHYYLDNHFEREARRLTA